MARITGILKDGMGKPIINCKIKLTALRTSATVIAHTVASQSPSEAGLYDMDVEPGHYRVTLGVSGYQPEYVGDIQVYHDSPSGTLNYFLGLPLDGDLRPDVMKEFEVMVAKVAAQASEVEKNKNSAADSAKAAQVSQQAAHNSESSASGSAAAASASQKAAAASERSALSSASAAKASQQAASNAENAAANSAAAAKVAEGNAASSKNAAATSAATASSKATEAASSASSASSSKEAAKAAETNAASSASESSRSATAARESANASRASADAASVAEKSAQSAKNDAVRKASEASSSASTASLKAQESAANAATSAQNKNAATSAATRAESAAGRAEQIAAGLSLKDASVTVKGIVQLNSSTNSTSESTAATPKAVKAAYDLADSKTTAEFVTRKIAELVGSAPGVMDTLQEIAAALNNNPNFANEIIRQLSGKQPLNATLTALSGKNVNQIIEYLGLRGTVAQAAGALQKSGGTVSGNIAITANLATDSFADKTTHIGQAYLSYVTLSDWAKPIGASEMCKPDSAGAPNGFVGGYWHVLGRRDISGGYAGLLCGYGTADLWFGFNAVGKSSPEFARIYTERYKPTPGSIGALDKNQNGADIPNKDSFLQAIRGARAIPIINIDGTNGDWTTEQFTQWLESQGAFNFPYWVCKGGWTYSRSKTISDTGCGRIHLAGAVIEVMGNRGSKTIRITTPTTTSSNGVPNAQFTYINHGRDYSPGWRRDYNTRNPQPAFALGKTGDTAASDTGVAWDAPTGVYQANIPGASCLILHFNMGVGSCPAVQFRVNYRNGGIAYRSARDRAGFENGWIELMPATKTVQDIRLSTREQVQIWNGPGFGDQPPYVITGVLNGNRDELTDTIYRRALQKLINGTWYNVGGL
ncbi:prophage tail fiber N-terminal domain-containing protein [Edwardsiella tarda]|uniref:prophage tail fiber N-terminal domain-containing protein n=1 Tax=Edwardsiella tarda TaxID=636 RepID=UPI0039BECF38